MCPKSCLTPHLIHTARENTDKPNYVLNFHFFLTFHSLFPATTRPFYLLPAHLHLGFSQSDSQSKTYKYDMVIHFIFTIVCTKVYLNADICGPTN